MVESKLSAPSELNDILSDTTSRFEVCVRAMKVEDVKDVVAVHLAAFQGFFLTFLGRGFLTELYSAMIADISGIAIVYEYNGQVIGFVAGTMQASGFYRRLLQQRWWRFGFASVVPVLRRPRVILQLLRAFRLPQQTTVAPSLGTLMSIAVSPTHQTRGTGKALVEQFLQEAKNRGLKQVNLFTDRVNNDVVNRFYQNRGFICVRDYVTHEGRAMNEYIIDL